MTPRSRATRRAARSPPTYVSASDAEDATAPTPDCSPALGDVLPLGTTTVECSATDSGGLTTSGSFDITVVDTTAPALAGMPADRSLTTADPDGAVVTFTLPTATDVVDPDPAVACAPASGSLLPGRLDPGDVHRHGCQRQSTRARRSRSTWRSSSPSPGPRLGANRSGRMAARSSPTAAGRSRSRSSSSPTASNRPPAMHGSRSRRAAARPGCAPSSTWDGARWTAHLETGRLGGASCQVVSASLDGHVAGSFRLDLRGDVPAAKKR